MQTFKGTTTIRFRAIFTRNLKNASSPPLFTLTMMTNTCIEDKMILSAQGSAPSFDFIHIGKAVEKLLSDTCIFANQRVSVKALGSYVDLIENVTLYMVTYVGCDNAVSRTTCTLTYFKSIWVNIGVGSLSAVVYDISSLVLGGFTCQDSSFDGMTNFFKDIMANYHLMEDSNLVVKTRKFLAYILSLSFMKDLRIPYEQAFGRAREYANFQTRGIVGSSVDFIVIFMELVTEIMEKGRMYFKTGDWSCFFRDSNLYHDWLEGAERVLTQSEFVNDPESYRFHPSNASLAPLDPHTWRDEVSKLIEESGTISKYYGEMSGYEKSMLKNLTNKIKTIQNYDLSTRGAMRARVAPFSMLLYGGAKVGKSYISAMLFHQYAKVSTICGRPLTASDEFKYTRNAVDDFWVNFKSSMWFIELDDIAYKLPDKSPDIDETLKEVIRVVNNVPFVPTQAALEDKGRTPMQAEFVIGTTNTSDLNAQHYFSCPYAIQRRFPYVVTVIPKSEYSREENGQRVLDTSKVPAPIDGQYDDYWTFRVTEPVPRMGAGGRQHAEMREIAHFDDVTSFLSWFSNTVAQYIKGQGRVSKSMNNLEKVVICERCFLPTCTCEIGLALQSGRRLESLDEEDGVSLLDVLSSMQWDTITLYQTLPLLLCLIMLYVGRWMIFPLCILCCIAYGVSYYRICTRVEPKFIHILARSALKYCVDSYSRFILRSISLRMRHLRDKKYAVLAGMLTTVLGAYLLYKRFRNKTETPVDVEGSASSNDTGVRPQPSGPEERPNVWIKDDLPVSGFDYPIHSASLANKELVDVVPLFIKNTAHMRVFAQRGVDQLEAFAKAVCLGGHLWVTNNHNLPEDVTKLEMILAKDGQGMCRNQTLLITNSDLYRLPSCDLVFFRVQALPAMKDISKYFIKTIKGKFNAVLLKRNVDGSGNVKHVSGVIPVDTGYHTANLRFNSGVQKRNTWLGNVRYTEQTQSGDCGSLLVGKNGHGIILLGIHAAAARNDTTTEFVRVVSVPILQSDIEAAKAYFGQGILVQENAPVLIAPSASFDLLPPHEKSALHWHKGTGNYYGSLSGFRSRSESKVEQTLMAPYLLRHPTPSITYELKHGAPVMSSWEPLQIALTPMLNITTKIKQGVLDRCVSAFTLDILTHLPPAELSLLEVYDYHTVINGAPGVTFVDKMNRATSAGFPWSRSKKFFSHILDPTDEYPHAIEFTKEIMDRARDCENRYKRGERYKPVFSACFKDEAVSFSKIARKKTRVFCGAPLDYSLVVRKYLLSFIRVMQRNRYVFEAGPGTICQSQEWEDIYGYLTQHGTDRIVAGDYANFDKNMPASVILAAFQVIVNVLKAAGCSTEHITVVQCIAEDTAFPMINYFGELIEPYGTNPSGHPLTVIINSLANSLYMRYAYERLHPHHDLCGFRANVALFTYGDDNIMGVSHKAPFFNHTWIQSVMRDIGIEYTMADKDSESVPYISIHEASFLKREFRYDEEIGHIVCPLDHASIEKSLLIGVPSKSITKEHHALAVLASALQEYFWYGRDVYEERLEYFQGLATCLDLWQYISDTVNPFLTWEELRNRYDEASKVSCIGAWKNISRVANPDYEADIAPRKSWSEVVAPSEL